MAQAIATPRTTLWRVPNLLALPRAIFSDWAYANADQRDLRLDFLRGFAVFIMIVDHFGGASWLYLLTGNNAFYVSGAEAFVFISGLVVGMVYGGIAREQGLRIAQIKSLRRTLTLYKLTVFLTLSFSLLSRWLALPWADDLRIDE
ncbi:MAG: OpgC domain-containing protein, partial [Chloroflexota bacterium]